MAKVLKILGITLLALVAVIVIGPFLIPIPPLPDTTDAENLADPDSQFIEINGLKVHYKRYGTGEPYIILLHGFASSTFSWRNVTEPLSRVGTVIAYDRPAQGLTGRPLNGQWQGPNPYGQDYQPELLLRLMDQLRIEKAVLVGNSAGGTVAAMTAVQHPERVTALVLVDPAIYNNGPRFPAWVRPLLNSPQASRLAPLFVRSIEKRGMELLNLAWHDASRIPPEVFAGYRKPLQVKDWDKGLWELTRAPRTYDISQHLQEIRQPVLVITGDDDRIVPTDLSKRLAGELPDASLAVMPSCGHTPQEECPEPFLQAVLPFLQAHAIGK